MSARSSLNYPNPLTQAVINISASGNSTLVHGAVNKQVKVFRLKLLVAGATNILIQDGNNNVLDGPLDFSANQGMILDFTSIDMPPWYQTSIGNDLVINSSNAVQIGGNLDYLLS